MQRSVENRSVSRYAAAPCPDSLADVLERVLDRGVVVAGDIVVNVLNIELLTIKLRLIVASVDTAMGMGIDWWTRDPFLNSRARSMELEAENDRLRERLDALERRLGEADEAREVARREAPEREAAGGHE
jgi:hypothetical protein